MLYGTQQYVDWQAVTDNFAGVCCLSVQCTTKWCSGKVSSGIHQNMEAESSPKTLLFSSTNGVTYQTT
jgi:hypothetical protein